VGTTWYKEAALTTAAGTYNATTNTFRLRPLQQEAPIPFISPLLIRVMADVLKQYQSLLQ
jgi:hypothetical protein